MHDEPTLTVDAIARRTADGSRPSSVWPDKPVRSDSTRPEHNDVVKRAPVLFFIALLLGILALDFVYYNGFNAQDDRHLLAAAHMLAKADWPLTATQGGTISTPDLPGYYADFGGLRFVVTLPIAALFGLTGDVMLSAQITMVIWHVLLAGFAYLLAAALFDRLTACVATVLVATFPLVLVQATTIYPDIPMAALVLAALALFVGAHNRNNRRRSFGSGFLFYLSSAAKIQSLTFLPAVGIIWLRDTFKGAGFKSALRQALVFLSGMMLCLLLYMVIWRLVTGEWGHMYLVYSTQSETLANLATQQGLTPLSRLEALWNQGRTIFWGPFLCVLAAASFYTLWRVKNGWIIFAFFVWTFVYTNFGTASLTDYVPPPLVLRYNMTPAALLAIAVAAAITDGAGRLQRPWPGWGRIGGRTVLITCATTVLIASSLLQTWPTAGRFNNGLNTEAYVTAVERALAQAAGRPVVLSDEFNRLAIVFEGEDPSPLYPLATPVTPPFLYVFRAGAPRRAAEELVASGRCVEEFQILQIHGFTTNIERVGAWAFKGLEDRRHGPVLAEVRLVSDAQTCGGGN